MTAYEGRSWRRLFGGDRIAILHGVIAFLNANHRQKKDECFQIFTRISRGNQTERDIESLNGTSQDHCEPPLSHLRLCLRKATVEEVTLKRLATFKSKLQVSQHYDIYCDTGHGQVVINAIKKRLDDAAPEEYF